MNQILSNALMLSMAAAVCSALGAILAVPLAGPNMPLYRLACSQAALGAALLFLGSCDILPEAAAGITPQRTTLFFTLGASGSALTAQALRFLVLPSTHSDNSPVLQSEVLVVALVTFVSLSVHNLLEGMSILFAVNEGLETGVRLAAAISLENIPEGLCIALPLLFATGRPALAIRLALISGLFEPVGVLIPPIFLKNTMSQTAVSSTLAVIAGILVFIALAEMIPLAVKATGSTTVSSLSVWMGCGVLSATIFQPLLIYHARVGLVA